MNIYEQISDIISKNDVELFKFLFKSKDMENHRQYQQFFARFQSNINEFDKSLVEFSKLFEFLGWDVKTDKKQLFKAQFERERVRGGYGRYNASILVNVNKNSYATNVSLTKDSKMLYTYKTEGDILDAMSTIESADILSRFLIGCTLINLY
jgi:hypothetical protein